MGMEQTVQFAEGNVPRWTAVAALLAHRSFPIQVRMIDGQLAFPDEEPPESWRELRLAMPHGMVTVRRQPDRVLLVTWGNAERALVQDWNALTWAFTEAGAGEVLGPAGPVSAGDYLRTADLAPGFRP
jgi:hypothetical protein